VRNKVLRRVLEREQQAQQSSETQQAALSPVNYTFGTAQDRADGLVAVPITAKRGGDFMLNGLVALTPDGDLVSVDGRLTKNPSFWTRRVDVVRRYGRVNGVRVPLETRSTAHVLVVGVSTFNMCIEYETVNGLPAEPRTRCSYSEKN